MNEGKELLIDIISSYQGKLSLIEDKKIFINGVDIIDVYNKLVDDKYYLADIPVEFINQVILDNKYQSHIIFKKKIYQLRDLYLGQKGYGINIKDKEDYHKTLSTFMKLISNIIDSNANLEKKALINRIEILVSGVKYNEVINDYELIELITKEYDSIHFDKNMLKIMEYVTKHNYNILNDKNLEETLSITKEFKVEEIDDEIKEILKFLNINYNELPIDYKFALKDINVDSVKETFELIKHNKVEEYGILHFINKNNALDKLSLLLFSDVDSIKECVEVFRDNNGELDVKSVKKLINSILTVFIIEDNNFYKPMHNRFMENIELFKGLGINIASLLTKCPLIFITPTNNIKQVIDAFGKYNVEGKKVINKLYKVISYNHTLLIDNINVLSRYIDINEYLKGNNYNLLKVTHLNGKFHYISDKYEIINPDQIVSYLIKEIYDNDDRYMWGDINA